MAGERRTKISRQLPWSAGPELQDVLDAFPHYVLIVDEDHRIVGANDLVYRSAGPPEDVVGGYCPWVVHGACGPIEHCPLEDAVRTGECQEREIHDPSTQRWLLSAVYPLGKVSPEGRRLYLHTAADITAQKETERREHETMEHLQAVLLATVEVIARAVEAKDPYTAGHQQRVAALSEALAKSLGLDPGAVDAVRLAASVHDLGKIGVPSEILNKPGKLTAEEFDRIRQHPSIGSGILQPAAFPWPLAEMVLQHHERIDGSGYPSGLVGDEIMPEARIIAVADVVEAMSLDRPYRPALGIDEALEEISRSRASLFDPEVVDACIRLFREEGFLMPSVGEMYGAA